jgi:hypothetical protein
VDIYGFRFGAGTNQLTCRFSSSLANLNPGLMVVEGHFCCPKISLFDSQTICVMIADYRDC